VEFVCAVPRPNSAAKAAEVIMLQVQEPFQRMFCVDAAL